MKDRLIETIRAVPIAGKTYEEYVAAVAEKLIDEGDRKASEVAREIIAIIDRRIALNAKRVQGLDLYGKGLVRARDAGYKDIKEIIQQKYIGEDKNVTTNTEGEG